MIGGLIALALVGGGLCWWALRRRRQRARTDEKNWVAQNSGAGKRVDLNAGETETGPGSEHHHQQVREQERGVWGGHRHGLAGVISPFVHHDHTSANENGNGVTNGRPHMMQRWHSHRDYTSSRTRKGAGARPPVTRGHRSAASDPTGVRVHDVRGMRSRSGSRDSHGRNQSQSQSPNTSTSTSPVQVPSPSQRHGQSSSWAGHSNNFGAISPMSPYSPDGNGVISVAYRVPSRDAAAAMTSQDQRQHGEKRRAGNLPPGAAAAAMPGSLHGHDRLPRGIEEGWGSTTVEPSHEDKRRRRASDVLKRGLSLGRTRRPKEGNEGGDNGDVDTGREITNTTGKKRRTGGGKRGKRVVMNPASDAGSASGLSDGGEEGGLEKNANDLLRQFGTPADVAAHIPGARLPNARDRAHPPPQYGAVTAGGERETLVMNVERLGRQTRSAEMEGGES